MRPPETGSTRQRKIVPSAVSATCCLAAGFHGVVLTSNAAPHHPMWHTDGDWMRRMNTRITSP
ncbi:hypothetical protein ABZ192_32840 [Streptomyces sp. NPDC006235]|uniref:hypothetical protein n=1 Tax=Streptomyces sp. NPDC006235 TaxID=3156736 RepID=UPI0033AFA47F